MTAKPRLPLALGWTLALAGCLADDEPGYQTPPPPIMPAPPAPTAAAVAVPESEPEEADIAPAAPSDAEQRDDGAGAKEVADAGADAGAHTNIEGTNSDSADTESDAPTPATAADTLTISFEPGRALLSAILDGGDAAVEADRAGLESLLPLFAFVVEAEVEDVRDDLESARSGSAGRTGLDFAALTRDAPAARRDFEETSLALLRRRDAIRNRVLRLLPPAAQSAAPFFVFVVAGLPPGDPAALAPVGEERALLLDGPQLAALARRAGPHPAAMQDALGESLERLIAPELLHALYEKWADPRLAGRGANDPAAIAFAILDEGAAAYLALPAEERFDDQGRRRPAADAHARLALARFSEDLVALLDPATGDEERARLRFRLNNGPPREQWGAHGAALMIDAIERFGPTGRMREVMALGAGELARAYAAVSGRHAAAPPLSREARALLEEHGRYKRVD